MPKLLTITRRELGSYFGSPVVWVLTAAFLAFSGLLFATYLVPPAGESARQASMQPFLQLYGTVFLFVAPLLSMRLLSEEQRSGTLELLMTSPVRDWHVVVGKWLAAVLVGTAIIATTLVQAWIMQLLTPKGLDIGPLVTGYMGLVLLVAALLAIGVFTSALTENQVVAAFLAIMGTLVLWFLGYMSPSIAKPDSVPGAALKYLGLTDHMTSSGQGIIDTRDIVYFVMIIVVALYLAARVLESRRWR